MRSTLEISFREKSRSETSESSELSQIEVSVVIPCLNESRSIGICVDKAIAAFREASIPGEVVVADNGSTDGSIEIAEQRGARVVHAVLKGYGSALRKGIEEARRPIILMRDAAGRHHLLQNPRARSQ